MKKYQYSVFKRETGNAGGKAKNDAFDILLAEGYEPTYTPSSSRTIRIAQQMASLNKLKGDVDLIVQYPAVSEELMQMLVKKAGKIHSMTALVHDLRSVQGIGIESNKEFELLGFFDNIIVHNGAMAAFVRSQGYKGNIIEIELFDYLHDITRPVTEPSGKGIISIAGNLDKSRYVCDLDEVKGCAFNLYGSNNLLDLSVLRNGIYHGLLTSDEIVYKLEGDYGLVWDGDSIDGCTGSNGEYLKYNNPHKMSLYIAAGKPVITWKKAAVAGFVEKEGIGITVDSLRELSDIDLTEGYDLMRANVLRIKEREASGYYLRRAVASLQG